MIRRLSILLTFAIVAMPILCICHGSLAQATKPKADDPHACCKSDQPTREEHSGTCGHCDGSAVVTAAAPQNDIVPAVAPVMWLAPELVLSTTSLSIDPSATQPTDRVVAPPASTLFGLHCAQIC